MFNFLPKSQTPPPRVETRQERIIARQELIYIKVMVPLYAGAFIAFGISCLFLNK